MFLVRCKTNLCQIPNVIKRTGTDSYRACDYIIKGFAPAVNIAEVEQISFITVPMYVLMTKEGEVFEEKLALVNEKVKEEEATPSVISSRTKMWAGIERYFSIKPSSDDYTNEPPEQMENMSVFCDMRFVRFPALEFVLKSKTKTQWYFPTEENRQAAIMQINDLQAELLLMKGINHNAI